MTSPPGPSDGAEQALRYRFTVVELARGPEAQPQVEGFRTMLARVIGDGKPSLSAPQDFLAQLFDREPSVPPALVLGADIEPPQVTVKQRILMLGSESGHHEAH